MPLDTPIGGNFSDFTRARSLTPDDGLHGIGERAPDLRAGGDLFRRTLVVFERVVDGALDGYFSATYHIKPPHESGEAEDVLPP